MFETKLLQEAINHLRASMFSYLATVDGDRPNLRVMRTAEVDDDGTIWYVLHRSSPKMKEIMANNKVCVVAWANGLNLRIWGTATVATPKEASVHFDPEFINVFPEGVKHPEFAMIKVTPTEIDLKHIEG